MEATAAPAYLGNPKLVDPEEAFVASLSSCHMLTFLAVACKKKFVLDEYTDDAVGHMEKNENGKLAITRVELHPKLKFSGEKQPTEQELDEMHHFAHSECFIANSVKTEGHGREINFNCGVEADCVSRPVVIRRLAQAPLQHCQSA